MMTGVPTGMATHPAKSRWMSHQGNRSRSAVRDGSWSCEDCISYLPKGSQAPGRGVFGAVRGRFAAVGAHCTPESP